jgi:hypothetical protein
VPVIKNYGQARQPDCDKSESERESGKFVFRAHVAVGSILHLKYR